MITPPQGDINKDRPLSILFVDPEPRDRDAIRDFVAENDLPYTLFFEDNLEEGVRAFRNAAIDLVFLKNELVGASDLDPVEEFGRCPIVLTTDLSDENNLANTHPHTAFYDYLVKDLDQTYVSLLPARIDNVMARWDAEQSLRVSEARYLDLFNNAPDLYFLVDEAGKVLSVNKMGAAHLGYTMEELIGEDVLVVVHPDDREKVRHQVALMLDHPHEVHSLQFRKVRKDGSMLHVAERISTQRTENGQARVLRIICRDITQEILASRREKDLRERLARTERLESMALLAGSVAHDLNNILGPIVAYPDLIARQLDPNADVQRDIQMIKKSAVRAAEVIRDLLSLAHRGRYVMEPLDVNRVVTGFIESGDFTYIKSSNERVRMALNLAEDLHRVKGSEVHLVKVLLNLVKNAFEAMQDGGKVEISTANTVIEKPHIGYEAVQEGEYVLLSVSDTGVGIPDPDHGKIFEPFFTKKKYGYSGSGLGLSIVYGIVKDHGGYIDVVSREGEGTRFDLYLPTTHEAISEEPEEDIDIRGTERLLMVDDLADQREIASRLLISLGYKVMTAADGHEAVGLVKAASRGETEGFDLVILDMIMEEGFDGLDTLRAVRKLNPAQKAIIVSGYAETERVREALDLGAGCFLKKPYTVMGFGRAIRMELDRGKG